MKYLVSLLMVMCFLFSHAQNKSNKGKEFWVGYGYSWNFNNVDNGQINNQDFVLYLSADAPATVTVSISNTGWSQTVTIPANTVNAAVIIPKSGVNDCRILLEGLHNKAIHVESDTPIVVYAHMYNGMISAATMLMPVETYGYRNFSLNYSQATSGTNLPSAVLSNTSNAANDWFSYFFVIASENNTRLQITPSDTTRNGWLPSQTYTVNLNKGEIYCVMGKLLPGNAPWQASKDMTGSKVVSIAGADGNCHPVAMFSGSSGIRICKGDGGENMLQQVFPEQAWGTKYLTYHTLNNANTDINDHFKNFYRVAVSDPTTIVKRNGVALTGLINNFYYDLFDSTGGDYFESNKPMLVGQFTPNFTACWKPGPNGIGGTYGDPEMFYLSPIEQGKKDILFYANRKAFIDFNYINVIVPINGIASLKIDGTPFVPANIITHPNNPNYAVAVARILGTAAQHRVTCDSNIIGTMYGLGLYESYGYNIGCNINNLNNYGGVKNTFATNNFIDTISCPTTPLKLFIKIANVATSIHWKLSQVNGISPNADVIVNNPVAIGTEIINGRTYYIYTLPQDFTFANIGTFIIPVTYTSIAVGSCSNSENVNFEIKIKQGPKADFSIPNACPNQSITLTGTSINNGFTIGNYLWNFTDATTQNTVDAIKTFTSIGSFNVRYRIYASNGCVGDTTKAVTIGSPVTLTVQGNGKACADSIFTFTSSIPQSSTNPTTYYWDFGDGTTPITTTTNTVTHGFAASATTRTVRHAVAFTMGCGTDTVTFVVPIIKPNPTPVLFNIIGDTLCPNKPLLITSTATGIANWNWNFGVNTLTTAPPFNYTYSQANNYTISLIVKDINGCGSLASVKQITINPLPPINAGPDITLSPNNNVVINATIINPSAYSFLWSPVIALNNTSILNPITSTLINTTYTITATNNTTNCIAKDSMVVNTLLPLFIPNSFTPNGDNVNEKWIIPALAFYPNAIVSVYNRYGEKIFETKNYASNPWDGNYKFTAQPQGSYVYYIYFSADNVKTGMVNILK